MAEVLSQSEIDQLFHAISSGETVIEELAPTADKRVKVYDFSTANKFSKEQMRTLQIIFENLSRQLSTYFSGMLRTMCEVTVLSVEEQVFKEFNNSLPTTVVLTVINLAPLQGSLLMSMSPTVAYGIISRLFGGSGDPGDEDRTFTEIELAVLERITRQFLPMMIEAWEKITRVDPQLERVETSSQFTQIVNLNEAVAIITMQLRAGEVDGFLSFCIPHIAIEPIAKQLTTTFLFTSKASHKINDNAEVIQRRVLDMSVNCKAILAETTMTVGDILSLRLGDVIQLDNHVGDDIKVKVEHIPKAFGSLGVKSNRYAVKLNKIMKEEEPMDE